MEADNIFVGDEGKARERAEKPRAVFFNSSQSDHKTLGTDKNFGAPAFDAGGCPSCFFSPIQNFGDR